MRQLDSAFLEHITSGSTTLVNCWRIIRLDGEVLGFSNHDEELEFDGTIFLPTFGADIGEIASKLGAQTDSSEIVGIINSDAISETDILLGRYDGAVVESYKVNWKDVNIHHLLRKDYIGEITRSDGIFHAELRSAQYAMNIAKGKTYQAFCNARLGDSACSIDLENVNYKVVKTVSSIKNRFCVTTSLITGFESDFFSFGKAIWNDGAREGKFDIITAQKNEGALSIISFSEPIIDWVKVGDSFTLYAGCDRHFSTCQEKFSNVINFRGFPHIPGTDFILCYPKNTNSFDGEPLFK